MISAWPITKTPDEVGVNQLRDGSAKQAFLHWLRAWSDIRDHLSFMYLHAKGNILELGTRGGVSTSALLSGVEVSGGQVFSVDKDARCAAAFEGHNQWTFICDDSLAPGSAQELLGMTFDMVFIDTEHTRERLDAELRLWTPNVNKGGMILLHDVETFPELQEVALTFASRKNFKYRAMPGSNGLGVMTV